MLPSSSAGVRGVRVEEQGGEKILTWRWFRWRMVGTALFAAAWCAVLGFILYFPLTSPAARKSVSLSGRMVVLVLVATALAMVYATAAHLFNRTTIRVSHIRLSIAHGPLPWFGGRGVALADIAGVDCAEKRNSDYNTAFQTAVSYSVRLSLKNGGRVTVASWLDDPETAMAITQFLTQQISAATDRDHLHHRRGGPLLP